METIQKSIEVNVPLHTAYNQWTQFETFPEFMEGIQEVRQLDDRHVHWVADIGGKHKEWDAEIVEQIPDQRIQWRSTSGARNDGLVEFEPISDSQTHVTVKMNYETEGVLEGIGDFFGVTSTRVEGDLERFKEFVETRGAETGGWRGEVRPGSGSTGSASLSNSSMPGSSGNSMSGTGTMGGSQSDATRYGSSSTNTGGYGNDPSSGLSGQSHSMSESEDVSIGKQSNSRNKTTSDTSRRPQGGKGPDVGGNRSATRSDQDDV